MAPGQLPSPIIQLHPHHSLNRAAHCVQCSMALIHLSVEASGFDSSHCVSQVGIAPPDLGSRYPLLPPSLKPFLFALSVGFSSHVRAFQGPEDLLPSFSSLCFYVPKPGHQNLERLFLCCLYSTIFLEENQDLIVSYTSNFHSFSPLIQWAIEPSY